MAKWILCWTLRAGGACLALGGFAALRADARTEIEGTVSYVQPLSGSGLELELAADTNQWIVEVENAGGNSPVLSSRIRIAAEPDPATAGRWRVSGWDQVRLLTGFLQPLVTTAADLRRLGMAGPHAGCVMHLAGLVLAASPGRKTLALQDETGVVLLELKTCGDFVHPGQEIILDGNGMVEGDRVLAGDFPVVDDNDVHAMLQRSGPAYLKAGRHALRLAWFNQITPYGLEVYYAGPDLPRQRIPTSALFRLAPSADGTRHWVNGLDYECFEGNWMRVPEYDRLIPTKAGAATNFDLAVLPRIDNSGAQFTGFLQAPHDGIYTFTTISDDGCLLYIDEAPPVVKVTGQQQAPEPMTVSAHQTLRPDEDDRWAQAEGTVTFAARHDGALELELSSESGRMQVEVEDDSGAWPQILPQSRIRATGICLATRTTDGQTVAGRLVAPGMAQIEVLDLAPEYWSDRPIAPISSLPGVESLVHVRGTLRHQPGGGLLISDGSGAVPVQLPGTPPADATGIEAVGLCHRDGTNLTFDCAFYKSTAGPAAENAAALPLLVTAEQIKRLGRAEAQRGYPVKIRGVVTTTLDSGMFIEDATRSIYVRWHAPTDNDVPRVGEFWEIEGTTFAEFAPNVQASRATRLGTGTLPEPLRPTWDQLINGSLDTEYVEVQGIVTGTGPGGLTLLTRAGKISLDLPDIQPQELQHCEEALVRIRGCVIPVRDVRTQQLVPGHLQLSNPAITIDAPAPPDPFAIRLKHVPDLLLFDPAAGAFQRVKIAGQVVHQGDGQFFLMDGGNGLRVIPKSMDDVKAGDLVSVVGFPDLGGPASVLREALVHRISTAALPDPVTLPPNAPLDRRYDATLVRLQARLQAVDHDQSDQILELQAGTRDFAARLKITAGRLPGLEPGSLLELTGVYAGQGGDLASGRGIDSFELLLNSPADVSVRARPPWWNVRRAFAVLGGMTVVILGGLFWIAVLRRQVEERSNQLAEEIRRHERTERQRELEEERTRIARDLHDDLGATLTQIRFLSAVESRDAHLPENTRRRMEQVTEKSREMVASLDEIVWAVNPANDLLPILANYLCHFAEEFFQPTPIRCRLDVSDSLPPIALSSEVRHSLYLAAREALNNVAKHSQATEVWLRIHHEPVKGLCVTVEDNGCGLAPAGNPPPGEGLANMPNRMEQIGGKFECESRPGGGVICRMILPLKTGV